MQPAGAGLEGDVAELIQGRHIRHHLLLFGDAGDDAQPLVSFRKQQLKLLSHRGLIRILRVLDEPGGEVPGSQGIVPVALPHQFHVFPIQNGIDIDDIRAGCLWTAKNLRAPIVLAVLPEVGGLDVDSDGVANAIFGLGWHLPHARLLRTDGSGSTKQKQRDKKMLFHGYPRKPF